MREIRVHGQSRRYVHTRIGVGGRMDTLQCAIVLAKLERFDWELAQRAKVAARYDALLSGRLGLVGRGPERSSVYAQYTVVIDERERIQAVLHAAGIPTAVHYPVPIHLQPAYAHLSSPDCCPVAQDMAARVMSLPMGPYLPAAASHEVAATLLRAAGVSLPGSDEPAYSSCR
jgi:UDP-2-acetamido-2-deoxy-ribo-hexuluronate aminotransferase